MAVYIFILHSDDEQRGFASRCEFNFDDDLDASDAAQELEKECAVDVWCGDELIAQVKRGNEPLTIHDAHSG